MARSEDTIGGQPVTRDQWARRKAIWQSYDGCNCPPSFKRGERCTIDWVRCDGRIDRIFAQRKAEGLLLDSEEYVPREAET